MLQAIRDRMSGPIVWGIIGVLVLVFAIWGIGVQSFIGGGGNPTVAKVGGVKITEMQFRNAYNRAYQRLVSMMGDSFNPDSVDLAKFRQGVLENILQRTLLEQYARDQGYRTSDLEVYDYLKTIPAFQHKGQFSPALYRQVLARSGQSPEAFEHQVRDSLRVEQLRDTVLGTAVVVPKQVLTNWRISQQQRDFSIAVFDADQYAGQVKVTAAQVRAYYEKNKSQYIAPLKVKLAYVELAQSKLAAPPKPDKSVLKAIYDAQKASRFTVPGERRASHILITFGNDPAAAHKKIEAIAKQLKHGASFAKLARADSDDPGSRKKDGNLGWIRPGMMDPAFQKALFALSKPGQISPPVKTKYGWHLIRLDKIRPRHTLPFNDPQVQQQLLKTYDSRYLAKQFAADSSKLTDLAFENTASLAPVAKALGLKVHTSDWLTRKGGKGLFSKKALINVAFSDSVLKSGENSKPIQVGPADLVVVRKADEQPEHQQSFDAVKKQIRKHLVAQAEAAKAKAAAQSVLVSTRQGQPLAAAAKKAGVSDIKRYTAVSRQKKLNKNLLNAAFKLPQPTTKKPSTGLVNLSSGTYAVVSLSAVHEPSSPMAGGKLSSRFITAEHKLDQTLADAEFDAYRDYMKTQLKIEMETAPKTDNATNPDD